MKVGVLRVSLQVLNAHSLKEKRMVLRSLKDRLLNTFNVSVAEVGANDKWQAAEIGVAAVGNEARFVGTVMEKVKGFIGSNPAVRIIEAEVEIL
jgi:uncharacterized protein YlxP (DUF503 family)